MTDSILMGGLDVGHFVVISMPVMPCSVASDLSFFFYSAMLDKADAPSYVCIFVEVSLCTSVLFCVEEGRRNV